MSRTPITKRFWPKVDQSGECWLWTGKRTHDGYGQIRVGSADESHAMAHRVAYEIENGEIPAGMLVLHRCDNPSCVRPSHLFLGTCSDNVQDAISKHRMAVGAANPRAKLRDLDVVVIRHRYRFDRGVRRAATLKLLAQQFRVSKDSIWDIVSGRTWKHSIEACAV
jgi:hypothetical protein